MVEVHQTTLALQTILGRRTILRDRPTIQDRPHGSTQGSEASCSEEGEE